MKHKTWFRLVVKAIGILLIGFAIPEFALNLASFVTAMSSGIVGYGGAGLTSEDKVLLSITYFAGPIIQLGIGIYLLAGAQWLVNTCIPSNRPYCPECGYDLSDSSTDWCAECGVDLTHLFAERMKNRRIATPQSSKDSGNQQHGDKPE